MEHYCVTEFCSTVVNSHVPERINYEPGSQSLDTQELSSQVTQTTPSTQQPQQQHMSLL